MREGYFKFASLTSNKNLFQKLYNSKGVAVARAGEHQVRNKRNRGMQYCQNKMRKKKQSSKTCFVDAVHIRVEK